jgi:hyaluronan synthase
MWKGWLWRQPLICQLSVLQVSLTPLTMGIAFTYLVRWFLYGQSWEVTVVLAWLLLGRGIRGLSHLRQRPRDILVLPLVALMVIFIALFVKTFAILTMNRQGWLTRRSGLIGGEGQGAGSLSGTPS